MATSSVPTESTTSHCGVVVGNGNLVKKVAFPSEVLPIPTTLVSISTWLVGVGVVWISWAGCALCGIEVATMQLSWNMLMLPVVIAIQFAMILGIGFLLIVSLAFSAGLSALGWGLGYIGGLLCYGMSSAFLHAGVSGSAAAIFSLTFVVVGIYYALLGGIAILGLRAVASTATTHATGSLWSSSFRQVLSTARLWRRGGTLPRMIIGVHLATECRHVLSGFSISGQPESNESRSDAWQSYAQTCFASGRATRALLSACYYMRTVDTLVSSL